MALYVVLHHELAEEQPWVNAWLKDHQLIEAIQTTNEIGQLCREAKARNERVYVHRCGWGECAPIVCCSAEVEEVSPIDKSSMLVRFSRPIALNQMPPRTPVKHQNHYLV